MSSRTWVVLAAGAVLSLAVPPVAAGQDVAAADPGPATDAELWVAHYDGPAGADDTATALAVSPDGSRIFVTGGSRDATKPPRNDFLTVAYHPVSGAQLWTARYAGPSTTNPALVRDLVVSPDGARLFVTGATPGIGTGYDYTTVAYRADGVELWAARYDGPAVPVPGVVLSADTPRGMAVSPDGARVFVTGRSEGVDTASDYATVAYDAGTGEQLWVARHDGPGNFSDSAADVAVSPDGARVLVTGQSFGGSRDDYATLAYDAGTGEQLWGTRYDGKAAGADIATSLALSPDGAQVIVTGESVGTGTSTDYATVAYDIVTGTEQWIARYNGPADGVEYAAALAMSQDGSHVFVTGRSAGTTSFSDYATVAYDPATGVEQWVARYAGPGGDSCNPQLCDAAQAVVVSPDGSSVFVTGHSVGARVDPTPRGCSPGLVPRTSCNDYLTLAYDAMTGDELWLARHNGPGDGTDHGAGLAMSPDGSRVFATGWVQGVTTGYDYATVAYNAGSGPDR